MEWTAERKRKLLLGTSLVVGCLAKLWGGSIYNFSVYAIAVKKTFNYTQTEVDLQASMVNLGLAISFPAGMLYDRFGPRLTSSLGLILAFIGYILLWSSRRLLTFYSHHSGVLSLVFFIIGQGSSYTYMASLTTNINNFTSKNRGKIVALLDTMFGGSPALFAFIYFNVFVNGHVTDEENQDWTGFILMILIGSSVSNLLCVFFLKKIPDEIEEIPGKNSSSDNGDKQLGDASGLVDMDYLQQEYTEIQPTSANDGSAIEHDKRMTKTEQTKAYAMDFVQTFIKCRFQFILWMMMLFSTVAFVFIINITTILKSAHLEAYDGTFTVLIPMVGIAARMFLGPFSDFFQGRISRATIVLCATGIPYLIAQLTLVFAADNLIALFFVAILMGIAISTKWTLMPIIVSEVFDIKHFGRNWGVIVFFQALLAIAGQKVFGAVYDANVQVVATHECFGLICSQLTFVMNATLAFGGLILNVCLIKSINNLQLSKNCD